MATITLHIQPRASRSEVVGEFGDAIKVRVNAPPVDGAANEELVRFVAQRLGVRRADVTLVSGHSGRRKRLSINGLTAATARAQLLGK